jgi:hypothetical protein
MERRHYESVDYYFSKKEAARYLSNSDRWFEYQLSGPHPPPGFRLGKSWIFKKSELDHWLEQFRASVDLDRVVDEVLKDLR